MKVVDWRVIDGKINIYLTERKRFLERKRIFMNRQIHNQSELDTYVAFSKALELFRPLDKNAFNYRARKGEITTKEDEVGKTLYSVQSTLELRNRLLKKVSRRDRQQEVIIDWLKPTDITAALDLDQIVYHEMFLAEAEVYMAWRRKNPYISKAAFDAKDRRTCYGYLGLIPLPERVILDILSGKKDEKEITADEILTYDEPGDFTLLANSAVVHPDYPEVIHKIISGVMDFWYERYPEQRVRRIYAQAVSDAGRIMAQKLYLGPLYVIENEQLVRVEDAYVLDIEGVAASKVVRAFQEKLKKKGLAQGN